LDIDGVLFRHRSSWQFVHERLGTKKLAEVHRQAAFRGLIDYRDWAFVDVFLWRGSTKRQILPTFQDLMPGALELLELLYRDRVWVILLSGGLDITYTFFKHFVDLYISNKLIFSGNSLETVMVNVDSKRTFVNFLERCLNIDWSRTLAIGDGIIDLPVLERAEYSIAFNPDSVELTKVAKIVIYASTLHPVVHVVRKLLSS
jgi:phosphoserine phosphatase